MPKTSCALIRQPKAAGDRATVESCLELPQRNETTSAMLVLVEDILDSFGARRGTLCELV